MSAKGTHPPRPVRCAAYTRKSTEERLEKEFNSPGAQREAGEAYVKSQQHEGWTLLPERYDDGGFTGGNLERPALHRLLAAVRAGRIDVIVLYKIEWLSRSLFDFARLLETFDAHQVAFVSMTQLSTAARGPGYGTLRLANQALDDTPGHAVRRGALHAHQPVPLADAGRLRRPLPVRDRDPPGEHQGIVAPEV